MTRVARLHRGLVGFCSRPTPSVMRPPPSRPSVRPCGSLPGSTYRQLLPALVSSSISAPSGSPSAGHSYWEGRRRMGQLVVETEGDVLGVDRLLLARARCAGCRAGRSCPAVVVARDLAASGDLEDALPVVLGELEVRSDVGRRQESRGRRGGVSGISGHTSHLPAVLVIVQMLFGSVTVALSGTRWAVVGVEVGDRHGDGRVVRRCHGERDQVVDVLRVAEREADDRPGAVLRARRR